MVELADIVSELESWGSGRGVILQSEGDFFCSGGDLTTVKSIANPTDGFLMCSLMQNTLRKLQCLPLVSVCIVQGRALGGGAELATVTDFRLFTDIAEIAFVQGVMGVSPGWGGGTRLVQLIGYTKALDLFLTNRKVDAQEALSLGIADDIISKDNRFEESVLWLHERIKFEPHVIQSMKKMVIAGRDQASETSLETEKRLFTTLWGGPTFMGALKRNLKH